jgi:hypothetical protein
MKSPKGNVSESGQSIIELAIVLVLVVVIILVVIFLIAPILIALFGGFGALFAGFLISVKAGNPFPLVVASIIVTGFALLVAILWRKIKARR